MQGHNLSPVSSALTDSLNLPKSCATNCKPKMNNKHCRDTACHRPNSKPVRAAAEFWVWYSMNALLVNVLSLCQDDHLLALPFLASMVAVVLVGSVLRLFGCNLGRKATARGLVPGAVPLNHVCLCQFLQSLQQRSRRLCNGGAEQLNGQIQELNTVRTGTATVSALFAQLLGPTSTTNKKPANQKNAKMTAGRPPPHPLLLDDKQLSSVCIDLSAEYSSEKIAIAARPVQHCKPNYHNIYCICDGAELDEAEGAAVNILQ